MTASRRCPVCAGFLVFSFITDDIDPQNVYRCTRCVSSDERLYIAFEAGVIEVVARREGTGSKDAPFEWYVRPVQAEVTKRRRKAQELEDTIDLTGLLGTVPEDSYERRRKLQRVLKTKLETA